MSATAAAAAAGGKAATTNVHVDRVRLTAQQRRDAPSVQQADGDEDGSSLLAAFLYPLTPAHFLESVWKKKALHLAWGGDDDKAAGANGAATAVQPALAASGAGSKRKKGAQQQQQGKGKAAAASVPAPDRMAYVKRAHLQRLHLPSLLEETASDNIFVWMKPQPSATAVAAAAASSASALPATALHSFELDQSNPAHVAAAHTLHASGASLYFRSPPSMVPEYVGGFSAAVGLNFAGVEPEQPQSDAASSGSQPQPKGEIEVFCSRAGHVTDWHFDFMENFTLQLSGSKTWHLRRSKVSHPLRGATPHYTNTEVEEQQCKVHALTDGDFSWSDRPRTRSSAAAPAPGAAKQEQGEEYEYETVRLRAGDCFYHPAGIWHRVECDEDSVSANISLVATDWSSIVCDGLKQKLWCEDEWRAGVSIHSITEARSYLSKRLEHLRATVASFRADDFLPNALFLPRQSHYVIQSSPCDDDNCAALCARAALHQAAKEEQQAAEEEEEAPKRKKAKVASAAAAAPASASPSSPLLISSLGASPRFRVNPLGVLLRFDHSKRARAAAEAKRAARALRLQQREQEGAGSDDDEEEEEEEEEEAADSDAEEDDGEEKVGYVLHFSFGNESLESAVRVTIDVSALLVPEMETLRRLVMGAEKVTEFGWEQALKRGLSLPSAKGAAPKLRADKLRKLLFFFTQQGLLQLLP